MRGLLVLVLLGMFVGLGVVYFFSQGRDVRHSSQLMLGPVQQACDKQVLQQCWLVKEKPEEAYHQWAGEIAQFAFEPGYEYDLNLIEVKDDKTQGERTNKEYRVGKILRQEPVAAVWISEPHPRSMVVGGQQLMVQGGGRGLYEGNVVVELVTEAGDALVSQATKLQGAEGEWEVELSLPATMSAWMKLLARSPVPVGETILPVASYWLQGEETMR